MKHLLFTTIATSLFVGNIVFAQGQYKVTTNNPTTPSNSIFVWDLGQFEKLNGYGLGLNLNFYQNSFTNFNPSIPNRIQFGQWKSPTSAILGGETLDWVWIEMSDEYKRNFKRDKQPSIDRFQASLNNLTEIEITYVDQVQVTLDIPHYTCSNDGGGYGGTTSCEVTFTKRFQYNNHGLEVTLPGVAEKILFVDFSKISLIHQ